MLTNLLILFFGLVLVYISYSSSMKACPPARVEYRYIPRSFKEEQNDPVKPSEIFADMFSKPTPYVAGFGIGRPVTTDNINKDFISQS
jgi:hypothetical protein